jgi:hypothetical protein
MRDQISPNGKVYRFKPYHKWDDWTQRHCHVPKAVRNHMVVVIRKSPINNDNWRVATVKLLPTLIPPLREISLPTLT